MKKTERVFPFLKNIYFVLFGLIILFGAFSFYKKDLSWMLAAMVLMWVSNILYSVINIKERLFFFWMQITIGVFLILRPFIEALSGNEWWKVDNIDKKSFFVAVLIISISLVSMQIGAFVSSHVFCSRPRKVVINSDLSIKRRKFTDCLQVVSMVMFYITAIFFYIEGVEKVLYVHSHSYLQYYSDFVSRLPWFVSTIGAMMKYSLCIFLATFPRKRRAFCALFVFEVSGLLDLAVGMRGTIMLNSLFILIYYIVRDIKGNKEKWFGTIEKSIVLICTPLALVFMTAFSFIRSGLRVLNINILEMIKDFFVGQGVTFEVVARGISVMDQLPQREGRNYTFGQIIDYFVHGRLGQLVLGTEALPTGNSVINGTQSNSLSHNLSYLTKGKAYLDGEGWGSSYVLENYIDFGIIGVIILSILLGILLIWMLHYIGRHLLSDTIIFVSLLTIFYIPRAESSSWIMFIVTIQFWLCVGCCWLGAFISTKSSALQMIYSKLKIMPQPIDQEDKKRIAVVLKNRKIPMLITTLILILIIGAGIYTYNINRNELKGKIECSVQTPGAEYTNRRVTLSVVMEEKADYSYQFSETYDGKEKIVQEYSTSNEYTFITEEVGEFVFYVDVKDSEGHRGVLTYHLEVKNRP